MHCAIVDPLIGPTPRAALGPDSSDIHGHPVNDLREFAPPTKHLQAAEVSTHNVPTQPVRKTSTQDDPPAALRGPEPTAQPGGGNRDQGQEECEQFTGRAAARSEVDEVPDTPAQIHRRNGP